MHRQLFFTVICYSFFVTILSIKCYIGTDRQCKLTSDSNQSYCITYRFSCMHKNQTCNDQEQKRRHYAIGSEDLCSKLSKPKVYEDMVCCTTNECNRPDSGKCSLSQSRRRAMRKLNDVLDF